MAITIDLFLKKTQANGLLAVYVEGKQEDGLSCSGKEWYIISLVSQYISYEPPLLIALHINVIITKSNWDCALAKMTSANIAVTRNL